MAGRPLDRFADGVQYPLASPSKRCPQLDILGLLAERMEIQSVIISEIVPNREKQNDTGGAVA